MDGLNGLRMAVLAGIFILILGALRRVWGRGMWPPRDL
jgi:hypothetical protein